uniref:Late embryogenesis abundant protein LEA-2 subgroup domain-containing protein n=1 Tax=Triticum aestivum TaxID=4565 RepID=I3NM14_WHEAT|nr:hypothetical protein 1E5.1 [Triticum aestivum]
MAKTQPRGPAAEPLLPPPPYLSPHSPADFHDADDSYVLLVPVRLRRRLRRGCGRGRVAAALAALALLALAFLLWPSDPGVSVARLRLAHPPRRRHRLPRPAARHRRLRRRPRPRARRLYVDADLRLDGIRVVEDAIYLLEDLARGSIPFDAVVEVEGHLHFFLSIPVKLWIAIPLTRQLMLISTFVMGRIACVVHVNPHDQTIVHQDCYPKATLLRGKGVDKGAQKNYLASLALDGDVAGGGRPLSRQLRHRRSAHPSTSRSGATCLPQDARERRGEHDRRHDHHDRLDRPRRGPRGRGLTRTRARAASREEAANVHAHGGQKSGQEQWDRIGDTAVRAPTRTYQLRLPVKKQEVVNDEWIQDEDDLIQVQAVVSQDLRHTVEENF